LRTGLIALSCHKLPTEILGLKINDPTERLAWNEAAILKALGFLQAVSEGKDEPPEVKAEKIMEWIKNVRADR
jgi:hypothetical protein